MEEQIRGYADRVSKLFPEYNLIDLCCFWSIYANKAQWVITIGRGDDLCCADGDTFDAALAEVIAQAGV